MKLPLKAVFLLPVLVLVVVGLAGLVWQGAASTRDSAEAMLKADLPIIAQAIVTDVSKLIRVDLEILKALSLSPEAQAAARGESPENFQQVIHKSLAGMSSLGVDYATVYSLKGELLASSVPGPLGKVNVSDRDYFKAVSSGREHYISKAIVSRSNNKSVIILAQALRGPDGTLLGVFNGGVDLGGLTGQVSDTRIGSTGHVIILEPGGAAIAHPDPSQLLKDDVAKSDLGQRALAVRDQAIVATEDGRLAAVRKDPFTGWTFIVSAPMEDLQSQVTSSVNRQLALAAIVTLLLGGAIWLMASRVVTKPLAKCLEFAGVVAEGDLERGLDADFRCQELDGLGKALGAMVGTLKGNLRSIGEKEALAKGQADKAQQALLRAEEASHQAATSRSEGLAEAASMLDEVVHAVTQATDSLCGRMEKVEADVEHQQLRTTQTATAMEEMSSTIGEVSRNAAIAAQQTGQVETEAKSGHDLVEQAMRAIAGVDTLAGELRQAMHQLAGQTKAVDQVMTVISDIADQTNLLALNAAIEAARAGDAGRGFAVVADEVRKLAEKTMGATQEVETTIKAIQGGAKNNADKVDSVAQAAAQASGMAQNCGTALLEIVGVADQATAQVGLIATAAGQQSVASEEIALAVDQVRDVAENITQDMRLTKQAMRDLASQTEALETVISKLRGT